MELVKKNTLTKEEQYIYDLVALRCKTGDYLLLRNIHGCKRMWKFRRTGKHIIKVTGTCEGKDDIEVVLEKPYVIRKCISYILLWHNGKLPSDIIL